MNARQLGTLIALAAAAAILGAATPSRAAPAGPIVVPLTAADTEQQIAYTDVAAYDDYFAPRVVTITVGAAVRWRNVGQHPHSTTSDNGYRSWGLVPAPPTFPAGTPPPEATPTLGPPTTPTKVAPPTVGPTLPYVRGRVFLAITVNGWDVRLGREGQ